MFGVRKIKGDGKVEKKFKLTLEAFHGTILEVVPPVASSFTEC
jgi:hypothetical protein